MAVRLDFQHEIERRKQARRRDPLKLSLFFLGGLLVVLTCVYVYAQERVGVLETRVERKQFELGSLQAKAVEAEALDEAFQKKAQLRGALVERMEERFYWAPLLERVSRLVPGQMQLTRLHGEIAGEEKRCQVNLEGVVGGASPRESAERFRAEFRNALQTVYRDVQADFRELEDLPENSENKQQVTFQIQVRFLAGKEPPKPPPPRVKRARP